MQAGRRDIGRGCYGELCCATMPMLLCSMYKVFNFAVVVVILFELFCVGISQFFSLYEGFFFTRSSLWEFEAHPPKFKAPSLCPQFQAFVKVFFCCLVGEHGCGCMHNRPEYKMVDCM